MDKFCECIYWARVGKELMDGNIHHPDCPKRGKTKEEYLQAFLDEGYKVVFEHFGKDVVISVYRNEKQEARLHTTKTAKLNVLQVLYDMIHGNIHPAQELDTDYIN